MANEVDLVFETSLPIPFIVANATGIEQGTLLKLADPFTVSASTAVNDIVGGVAAAEKIASDGVLTLSVWRSGIFRGTALGTIGMGAAIVFSGNKLWAAAVNHENVAGISLEAASEDETFLWELRPTVMNLA